MSSGDTAMIRIAGKMCHLVRGPGTGEYWVVRGPGLRQPYIGPGAFGFKAGRATISLTLTATYGHVSRADLMADIEQFEPHEHIEPEPDKR
jgi:hypothetical protein